MVVTSRKAATGKTIHNRKPSPKLPLPIKRRNVNSQSLSRSRSSLGIPKKRGSLGTLPRDSKYKPTRLDVTFTDYPIENRRLVICDAESIAYNDVTQQYHGRPVEDAYRWFHLRGCNVLMLSPDYLSSKLVDRDLLGEIYGRVEYIHNIPDNAGNPSENHEFEKVLLQRAEAEGAVIVSERMFETTYHYGEQVALTRVVGFTVFKNKIFIPVDPYGRRGLWLRDIIHKN